MGWELATKKTLASTRSAAGFARSHRRLTRSLDGSAGGIRPGHQQPMSIALALPLLSQMDRCAQVGLAFVISGRFQPLVAD
jgi:hypothetical protein